MTTYYLRLVGPGAVGARVSGALLRDVLDVLVDGARRAVRLHVDGRSTARGREPRWLAPAAAFDVVGIKQGSTLLELEAVGISDQIRDLFAASERADATEPDLTGLGLFRETLEEAIAGGSDSDLLDAPILDTITTWKRVLDAGVDRIEFGNGRGAVTSIGPEELSRVQRLRDTTPPDQRVMVAGRLDMLRHNDRVFTLLLQNGLRIRGVVEESLVGSLGALWGRQVLVSARAVFKPSGKVLSLEADQIEPAPGNASIWAEEPKSLWAATDARLLHQPQGPRSGVNAIFGEWPGDETDEEVRGYLEEIS